MYFLGCVVVGGVGDFGFLCFEGGCCIVGDDVGVGGYVL